MTSHEITVYADRGDGVMKPRAIGAEVFGRWAVHPVIQRAGRARIVDRYAVTFVPNGRCISADFSREDAIKLATMLAKEANVDIFVRDIHAPIVRRIVRDLFGFELPPTPDNLPE